MKKTALNDLHKKINGKMTPFGGFELPVWYSSIKEEHKAVREKAGIFDISHMCPVQITGKDAFEFVQSLSCNDLSKAKTQTMVYTMLLNQEGMILDDVMVGGYKDGYFMVINASNAEKILDWMDKHLKGDVKIQRFNDTHSFLAVQGPKAIETLGITDLHPFGLKDLNLFGVDLLCLRTGYTGEDGVELLVDNKSVSTVWEKCLELGITPCGLGARDSLRIEAGLPLYGHELSESIHPLQTRYAKWVVKWDHDYIGKEALLKLKESNTQTTVGLMPVDRVIPRQGYKVVEGGEITSGTLSPTLDKPVALAMVDKKYADVDSEVTIEVRGKTYCARVVKLPFITRRAS